MANVGYATLQIIPSAKGFTTALNSQVAPGMAAAGTSSSKKFGGSFIAGFKSIAGPLAAVAGTAAIGNFLKGAVTGASDLNETVSKTGVIFKGATDEVIKFAEDSKRNILLTKQEALDAASTFGIFGKSAGLTGKDLAGFSTELTALSSDLSSFFNTTTDEAIVAIGAALRGESEPIRRFGVLLDDASLRAEALRQGLVKTTKQALTPQQRVLAAQALILKQTTDAQGDAARTSANFANQTRILRKNFIDIRNEVGTALLPVVTKLTTLLAENLRPAFEALKTLAAPIVNFFKSFSSGTGQATAASEQFKNTISAIQNFLRPLVDTLRDLGSQAAATLGPAIQSIGDVIVNNFLPAVQAILPVLRPVAQFLLKVIGGAVIGALKGALNIIKGQIKIISGIFNAFAGLFTGDWKKLWDGVKQIFSGAWDAIKGLFELALNVGIIKAFRTAGTLIVNIGKSIWPLLKSAFSNGLNVLINLIKAYPKAVLSVFSSGKNLLLQAGKDIISGFINGIKAMGPAIIASIKSTITDKLPSFVKSALGIASPSKVFAAIGRDVGLGFIKGVQGTRDQILSVFSKLAEDVKKTGSKKLIEAVADAQKRILKLAKTRDALREQYKEATTALRDLKAEAKDFAKSIVDSFRSFTSVASFAFANVDLPSLAKDLAEANKDVAASQAEVDQLTKVLGETLTKYGVDSEQVADARARLADAERELAAAQDASTDAQKKLNDAQEASLVTTQKIIDDFKSRITAATSFFSQIKQLQNLGLNQTSLQEILNAGVENGGKIAQAIIEGGKGAVKEVNELQSLFEKEAADLGGAISSQVYNAAIADAEKTVIKLADDLTKTEKKIVGLAATLAKELAKIGNLPAPAWLKDLMTFTKLTASSSAGLTSSKTINGALAKTGSGNVTSSSTPIEVNVYNPTEEPTSVTVSNVLTRLALLEAR